MRRSWLLTSLLIASPVPVAAQATGNAMMLIRVDVDAALKLSASGGLDAARGPLLAILARCGPQDSEFARECRALTNYSLGYVHQVGGGGDPDALLREAVDYYDEVLRDDPGNRDAVYNKTLAYRAMGAREWQEAWFRTAAQDDPARRATYLSLLGDYYMERALPDAAAGAYRDAIAADPDAAGARAGLVTALRGTGRAGLDGLLATAGDWRVESTRASADAYQAVLETVMAEPVPPEGEPRADEAIVQLVMLRDRIDEPPFIATRADLPGLDTWRPTLELDAFLRSADPDSARWWTRNAERARALATAALRRGIDAAASGNQDLAERLWIAGVRVAENRSAEAVDLQRELALLYTRDRAMDPEGGKFRALENEMFQDKGEALATGDLEAAQRFHSTLGLIYSERGTWQSAIPARNAVDQLTWAVRAERRRAVEEGFHQPLPGVRAGLVVALDSAGRRAEVRDASLDAVRAWLDSDELDAAADAARTAERVGADPARLEALIALRGAIAAGGNITAPCASIDATTTGSGPSDFERRQRFKMHADCAVDERSARSHRLAALAATDTAGFTLIGVRDVRRFDAVFENLVPGGATSRAGRRHLDAEAGPGSTRIAVSLATETVPHAYVLSADEALALRTARATGPTTR